MYYSCVAFWSRFTARFLDKMSELEQEGRKLLLAHVHEIVNHLSVIFYVLNLFKLILFLIFRLSCIEAMAVHLCHLKASYVIAQVSGNVSRCICSAERIDQIA